MKLNKENMLLYAATDRRWLGDKTLASQVEKSIEGGVTCIQLREKELDDEEFLNEALEIKKICNKYNVPFIINDNVEVALKCGADGIHVGQSDMNAGSLRRLVGEEMIIGVSAGTVDEALEAAANGADYIGTGSVFVTSTKDDADHVTYDTLKEICSAVEIPVVAIGGITRENIQELQGSGVDGIAVVSALFAQEDIKSAAAELLELSGRMVSGK
ncbi:MAG: thiamine phosphate synthase [Ruminococcus sp.]|nr:thiamine phosphate synthase [Ruminococcus sp.]